ncbi:MAG: hypothetical protein QHC89_10335 [Bosea sp. (in: a-proteobacteria)]|nr:hypothetical protein [Bosea sp. (in: a-proteobacteria)]
MPPFTSCFVKGTSPKRGILDRDLAHLLRPLQLADLLRNSENATSDRKSRNQKNGFA